MTVDYSPSNPLVLPLDVAAWLGALPQPIAITGGTGFVGSHLVDTLCGAGLRPRLLVRDAADPRWIGGAETDLIEGSLSEPEALMRLVEGTGVVIHLAGVVRAARRSDFDRGNLQGTAALVEAIRETASDSRLVHVSSLAAMGPSSDPDGLGPGDPPAPISAYGRSKLGGEHAVAGLNDSSWWCILRPPAIYGPRDTDVLEFFKMAGRGMAAVPAGERWLTVAYVGDVVRAVLAAAAGGSHREIYHLGEPAPQRLDRLLEGLGAAGGRRVRIVPIPSAVIVGAGVAGSVLQRLGWRRMPLTRDKATELLARHWTSQTMSSLNALGVGVGTTFANGAETTWQWYRMKGWLR